MLSRRDMVVYALAGFGVWLSGAVEFRFTGRWLFESGPLVSALSALVIAVAVCLILRTTLRWRGTPQRLAVTVAVVMGLPGLFAEAVRQLFFGWATGLSPQTGPAFAATMFFGNAVLLAYALWWAHTAPRR